MADTCLPTLILSNLQLLAIRDLNKKAENEDDVFCFFVRGVARPDLHQLLVLGLGCVSDVNRLLQIKTCYISQTYFFKHHM